MVARRQDDASQAVLGQWSSQVRSGVGAFGVCTDPAVVGASALGLPAGGAAAAGIPAGLPPGVTRGIQSHGGAPLVGVEQSYGSLFVGLDWLNGSGARERLADGKRLLCKWFGDEVTERKGIHFYERALRWPCGAMLLFGGEVNGEHCCLSVPGKAFALMEGGEHIRFLRDVRRNGFKVTRIDVAVDLRGEGLRIVQDATASAMGGEACYVREVQPIPGKFKQCKGRLIPQGATVKLGSRPHREIRIYEKDLEQGTGRPGTWHRIEVQYGGDGAQYVASLLLQADRWDRGEIAGPDCIGGVDGADACRGWVLQAAKIVFGATDFREAPEGRRRELNRRRRVAWWAALVDSVRPFHVKVSRRKDGDWRKGLKWLERCVLPSLARLSAELGCDLGRLVGWIRERSDDPRVADLKGWMADLIFSGEAQELRPSMRGAPDGGGGRMVGRAYWGAVIDGVRE